MRIFIDIHLSTHLIIDQTFVLQLSNFGSFDKIKIFKMFSKNIAENNAIIFPPPNPKYTLRDWEHNNKAKARISEDQQKLANRVIR